MGTHPKDVTARCPLGLPGSLAQRPDGAPSPGLRLPGFGPVAPRGQSPTPATTASRPRLCWRRERASSRRSFADPPSPADADPGGSRAAALTGGGDGDGDGDAHACVPALAGSSSCFLPSRRGHSAHVNSPRGQDDTVIVRGGDAGAQTAVRGRARGAQGPDGGRARPGRLSRGPPTPPHGCLCSAESVKGQRAPGPGGDPGTLSFAGGCARMETRACRWRGEWPAPLGKRAPFGKKRQSRTPFLLFGVGRLRSQKLPGAERSREASVSAVGWRWPGRPGSARWKGRPARASSPRWPRYRQNRSPGPHSGRYVAQAPPGFWGAALRRAREPAGLPGDTARGRREPQTSGRVRREGPPMADGGVDVDDAGCAGHAGPRHMPVVAPLTSPRAPHGGPRRTPVVLAVRKPVRLLTR